MKKQANTNMIVPAPANLSTSFYTPPRPLFNPKKESALKDTSLFKDNISPSPSNSRRLSRAFSSFMNLGSPLLLSARRQMSTTSLNVCVLLNIKIIFFFLLI